MTGPRLDTEHLLEHTGWMRRLALSLVKDRDRAEDLAQDTWVRALECPPRREQPIRAWLTVVMRNLLRKEQRGTQRRQDREARVRELCPTVAEDAPNALARATAQRELLQSVIELEEPYRSTLLLRYFEGFTPRRIAELQEVPTSTVKTRLARGLERLRRRLEPDGGTQPGGWMLALAPILRAPSGSAPPWLSAASIPKFSLGALVMNAKLASLLIVAAALGTGYLLVNESSEERDTEMHDAQPAAPRDLANSSPPGEAGPLTTQPRTNGIEARVAIVGADPEQPRDSPQAASATLRVRGRVVDLSGGAVAGVRVLPDGKTGNHGSPSPLESAITDANGSFEVQLRTPRNLRVEDKRFVTVLAGVPVNANLDKETVLVVAPRIQLAGRVLDDLNLGIAGARVILSPKESLRSDLGLLLDYSLEVNFATESTADGSFQFESAPGLAGGSLVAHQRGFSPAHVPAPTADRTNLLLLLERPRPKRATLQGVVLDAVGSPVAGARVSLGLDSTRSGSDGGFSFDFGDPESFNVRLSEFIAVEMDRLLALHPGHLPAELQAIGVDAEGRALWPDPIVLRLGGTPLTLAGRVVDEEAEPLSGIRVWLKDPTFFGGLGAARGDSFPRLTHVESELGDLDPDWPFVETGLDGRFRLTGLLDREYTLEAMDPTTLLRVRSSVRPAGAPVEVMLASETLYASLSGRIVDGRGEPVAGASVQTHCDAFRVQAQGRVMSTRHASGAGTTTDREGRFRLARVPKDLVYLRIDHPDTIPLEWGRAEQRLGDLVGQNQDDVHVTVMRRCHFRVEIADPGSADEVQVLDSDGEPLGISEFQGNGRRDGPRARLVEGRTNLLAVGDRAATLVLLLGGSEVRRSSIRLMPGEQVTIRP